MKKRIGFVSNSSSSSFCLLGISFENDKEYYNEKIENSKSNLDYEWACNSYDDTFTVGFSPDKMKDDETLLQFKQRIIDEFKKEGFDYTPDDLDWIIDGGYDG
jgi:hypothetical protein